MVRIHVGGWGLSEHTLRVEVKIHEPDSVLVSTTRDSTTTGPVPHSTPLFTHGELELGWVRGLFFYDVFP